MPVATVTLFLALLAALLTIFVVGLAGLLAFDRGDRLGLLGEIKPAAIPLAGAVAVTSTLGSLYLSEVAGFEPCRLCWVQRGFMYPAAVLLVAGYFSRRWWLLAGAGALAIGGLPVSVFHRFEQASGPVGDFCDPVVPCSQAYVNHFGFVTIPTMAGIGFVAIFMLVGVHFLWRNS